MSEAAAVVTVKRRYRYIYEDVDRHGNVRVYFWRGAGHHKVRVQERIGSPEFDQRYGELLAQSDAGAFKPEKQGAPKPRTLRWLGTKYASSAQFEQLDPSTQTVAKRVLDAIYAEPVAPGAKETFGDCPLASFTAKSAAILRDRKKDVPEGANSRIKRLRTMFKWALLPENREFGVTTNPARDVSKLQPKRKGGFRRWTPVDLDRYEERHPVGSQARLALALFMFTGVRKSDVVRLGLQMARDGALTWIQHKGRNRNPTEVSLPILPELQRIIDATPIVGTTTYLVTQHGRPFTATGFGNKMADWCKQAGVPGRSHGLRKAAATRAADRGATTHALMAMFGWLDIKQAELYTREASRRRLARENAHLLGTDGDQIFPTLDQGDTPVGKKQAKS